MKMTKGWGPWRYEWYSICSMHWQNIDSCGMCNAGAWQNAWRVKFGQIVFALAPDLWRWWANRPAGKEAFIKKINGRYSP